MVSASVYQHIYFEIAKFFTDVFFNSLALNKQIFVLHIQNFFILQALSLAY